ncbi:MAG: V-type ATP synthase subunit I [Actinomycetota bacterium]
MGVATLKKFLIVTHKLEQSEVLNQLQDVGLVELKPYTEKVESIPTAPSTSEQYTADVKKALDLFGKYRKEKKPGAEAGKLAISRKEYQNILDSHNFEQIIEQVLKTEEEINIINSEITNIKKQLQELKSWQPYQGKLEDLKSTDTYTVKLGRVHCRQKEFTELKPQFEEKKISVQKLSEHKDIIFLILAYHNDFKKEADQFLNDMPFTGAELFNYRGTIKENIDRLTKSLNFHQGQKEKLVEDIREISEKHNRNLVVYLNYLENNIDIENAINYGFSTKEVSFYTAWIEKENQNNLYSILDKFSSTRLIEIEPDKGETIPTALKNKRLFKPFEIIVNLYGVPKYFEIDPTPFVSLFFALFFGLCLTDAGYGIILMILAVIFSFKIKPAKNFLMLMFFGGIFTVFSGIVFNGWFGDLPSYLGFGHMTMNLAILGDPVEGNVGAMNFFRLALAVGVVQVMFGLFIKFFDAIRRKDWAEAFFEGLPWITILTPLIMLLLSSSMAVDMQIIEQPLFPSSWAKYLIWPIIPSAIIIILFSARNEKSWGFRLFMGFLNLTIVNGLTSYLGDFLSYIRLMALGLVTAGIAVAINQIAFQIGTIPVVGIVITVIVLIFGHIFNLGINVLGGFVHTLRLQYVEYFQKFYVGGGRPFQPLKNKNKYITIVDE